MTDEQIKAWLAEHGPVDQYTWQNLADCLTELLAHRELHRAIKWAVWVADQSAESGWTALAWFPSKGGAVAFRVWRNSPEQMLVLPFQERTCLTAR